MPRHIDIDQDVRDELATRRVAIGASLHAVALAAGVHHGTVEAWEAGRWTPTDANLRAWHYALVTLENGMIEYLAGLIATGRPEPVGL